MLKNLTNLLVLAGDWFLYRRSYRANVWGCVGLMMVSALLAAATDLTFNAAGYLWQVGAGQSLCQIFEGLWGGAAFHAAGYAWLAACAKSPGCLPADDRFTAGTPLHLHGSTSPLPPCLPAPHLQAVNNCFTAGYTLYLRGAMDRAARHTSDGQRLGEFSMVGAGPGGAGGGGGYV